MANWAIVIGINQYWEPARCLKGGVGDAMRIVDWLLKSPECQVPPENLFLLTRPQPAQIPAGVNYLDATADNLLLTIPELDGKSGGKGGDRFFFYFSGHGITNYESFRDEQALVMADFTPKLTNKALKFKPITEYFKATPFREQFFFVDACRNLLPWPYDFETGSTTVKKEIDLKQPPVDQFILNSTAPLSKAWEGLLTVDAAPGDERGAFTATLLDGIKGDGTAKIYNSDKDNYIVYKDSLFDYVIRKIEERKIYVVKDPVNPVIQRPRKDGESARNPVLAQIELNAIAPQSLELFVEPSDVWPQAQLKIDGENHEFQMTFNPPVTGVPLALPELQPMIYTVHASAPSYVPEGNRKRWSFPLYEPTRFSVRLVPLQAAVISTASEPLPSLPPMPEGASSEGGLKSIDDLPGAGGVGTLSSGVLSAVGGTKGLDDIELLPGDTGRAHMEVMPQQRTRLIVTATDPLAPLEIADNAGVLLKAGQGELTLEDLAPGFYRVRLITPEGKNVEEFVELSDGETEQAWLTPPAPPQTRLVRKVIASANFLVKDDNNLEVSEMVGPIASAQLSTILALAANVSNRDEHWGTRLKSLGLTPFKETAGANANAGLQIISGIEFSRAE